MQAAKEEVREEVEAAARAKQRELQSQVCVFGRACGRGGCRVGMKGRAAGLERWGMAQEGCSGVRWADREL